jgi:hypothetical protein
MPEHLAPITGLVVRPGDVLILTTAAPVTTEQFESIRQQALQRLPGLGDVVIISNVTAVAAFRPEEAIHA